MLSGMPKRFPREFTHVKFPERACRETRPYTNAFQWYPWAVKPSLNLPKATVAPRRFPEESVLR